VKKRIHKTNKAIYITYQDKQNILSSTKEIKQKKLNILSETKNDLVNYYFKNKINYNSLLYILQRKAINN
jgi:hypothetical protein